MQKPKMMKLSDIEWMAILKSIIFIALCTAIAFCVIVFASVTLVSLATNGFEKSFEITKSNAFVVRILADSVLFFGLWKSWSFIPHHKLQHMSIIAFILCLPAMADVFFGDIIWLGILVNCTFIYSLMFLAYFIRRAEMLWRKGRDAKA